MATSLSDRISMQYYIDAGGVPGRPLEPLQVHHHRGTGELWLQWRVAADRPEHWPVVGFVVEAMSRETAAEWTGVGSVARDIMSEEQTTFRLDNEFMNGGPYAFRVFADNRAAFSDPLESRWITPDDIGISTITTTIMIAGYELAGRWGRVDLCYFAISPLFSQYPPVARKCICHL